MEDVITVLKELLVRHEEPLDTFDADFKRSREDFEFKINALVDAQLKNEEEIAELRTSTRELRESTRELREASLSQLSRIERLESTL